MKESIINISIVIYCLTSSIFFISFIFILFNISLDTLIRFFN